MTRSIKKILIANRGEIALRIMRTCREMNIATVAVYSEIDIHSPFVRFADESYCIGPAPASESYLNKEKIILAAKVSHADAIHPGYGFLSENAGFAALVENENIIFIGPSTEIIKQMGDKTSARNVAKSINIPMVPGTVEPIDSVEKIKEVAKAIGYPVLIKASAGGGGKGMRIVRKDNEIESAFRSSQSEAMSAFGDKRVYVEKYLENPRHIEVQILADHLGNVIHLGERECSIQRRHQKIIEESPSIAITDSLRESITNSAVKLAKRGQYTNAGTVEFLLDANNNYYFMEMNTRLQVEHPVTEMRTGIDLVREQIRIAEGKPLSFTQEGVTFNGHAIECRLYAEDSSNNFFPSTGTIVSLKSPTGMGIREDRGVEEGSTISAYYDPMISKLISWGKDRNEAISRMSIALSNYELFGVKNNIDLCLWIVNNLKYRNNEIDTNFISNNFSLDEITRYADEILEAAFIAAGIFDSAYANKTHKNPLNESLNRWRDQRKEYLR